jgi:hypothetical protein
MPVASPFIVDHTPLVSGAVLSSGGLAPAEGPRHTPAPGGAPVQSPAPAPIAVSAMSDAEAPVAFPSPSVIPLPPGEGPATVPQGGPEAFAPLFPARPKTVLPAPHSPVPIEPSPAFQSPFTMEGTASPPPGPPSTG